MRAELAHFLRSSCVASYANRFLCCYILIFYPNLYTGRFHKFIFVKYPRITIVENLCSSISTLCVQYETCTDLAQIELFYQFYIGHRLWGWNKKKQLSPIPFSTILQTYYSDLYRLQHTANHQLPYEIVDKFCKSSCHLDISCIWPHSVLRQNLLQTLLTILVSIWPALHLYAPYDSVLAVQYGH